MNKYKCFGCGNSWFVSHDKNGHAVQYTCPICGSDRVQYVLDSLVGDLHAGVTVTNPAILCMPSGQGNGFRFQKWMTD